jgi:predicted house-cleaning NTP pyrophosphatase (Maf/HAM1 superfamily)
MLENNIKTDLVLATASPRRAQLLSLLGLNFLVRPVEVVEIVKPDPKETVITNTRRKTEKALMLDN